MHKHRKPAKPPNIAAKALRDTLFKLRIVKTGKIYSRKVKHKKGSDDYAAPLLFSGVQK